MSEKRDKSNKRFMLLSAIGIFMVVDHHTFTAFNIFGDILPYNSFFMPMFVFISGYFNKVDGSTNLWTYFKKKVKTLLIPYIGLSLTVFTLQQLINFIKLGDEMTPLPSDYLSYVLKRIVTVGSFGAIVEPMWFVIALFSALMIYAVLKKFLYKIWNSYIMFALFLGLHIFVIYLAKNADMESLEYLLVPLKCLFFFPFLELGIIYRDHLEKKHIAMSGGSKIALLFILLVINMIRTNYLPYAYDVAFDSIDELAGFTSPFFITPLISSIIGILFWLTFTDLIGKQVYESRFVNFMSCNTFWIMGLHITFYNIFNCILMAISKCITEIPYFDVDAFRDTEWYFWELSSTVKILYVIIGILGPLGLKWLFDKICSVISAKIVIPVLLLLAVAVFLITRPGEANAREIPEQTLYEETDTGVTVPDETVPDETVPEESIPEQPGEIDLIPAYAFLDLAYENEGEYADYLADPYAVYDNGTYMVTIRRQDNEETPLAFDGLSYMGIRLIDDGTADIDISEAVITDIKVTCDSIPLTVAESDTVSYDEGARYSYFDCYAEGTVISEETPEDAVYDFKNKDIIEVTFTVSGIKQKAQ